MHVSDFPLLCVGCFRYSSISIHAFYLLICSIYSCTTFPYALHLFLFFHVSAVYVLPLFIHCYLRCNHLCIIVIYTLQLFIYYTHWFVTVIYALHLSMCCTYLCIAPIYLMHSFHISHSFNDMSHLFICCIHSCISLSMRYVTSLFSCISHAACSLITSFFFLTYIKSQTSWQECFTTTIKVSMQTDVHKIYCWPTQLLFSFSS